MMPLFYFILINKLIAHVTDAFVCPTQPRFDNKKMFSASTFNSGDIRKTVPSSVAVRLIEPIGNGTFGGVYWAEDIVSGEMFVAKSARATTPGALAQKNAKSYLEIESYINSKLLRPRSSKDAVYQKHLAPFLGETEINKTRYLIWHKSGEYTLEDYIEMDDGWVQLAKDLRLGDCNRVLLHQKLAKEVLRQLLEGVAYCHSLGVIHRDIKPANVLVDPKTNTLRLIDFGSACDMSGWTSKAGYRGQNKGPRSILYCAPEEFIDEENPYAFDVYGVAVTWLRTILSEDEILNNETDTRQSSFGLGNEENLFKWRLAVRDFSHCLVSWEEYAVLHNEVPFGWHCLFGSSREGIHALRLLSSMMNYSPGNRISASEALLGPYLNADCNAELPPELPPAMPWSLSSHVQRWKKEREVQHEECRLEDLFTDVVAVELEFPLGIIFETQKGGGVKVAGIESKAELTQKMVREGDTLLAIGSLDVEGASLEHIKELLDQWGADKITAPLLLVRASGYSG